MILRSLTRWPGRAAFTLFGRRRLGRDPGRLALHLRRDRVPDRREPVPRQPPARDPDPQRGAHRGRGHRGRGHAGRARGPRACLTVPVTLRTGPVERRATLEGRPPGAVLARLLDADGRPVAMPEHGLLISDKLARSARRRPRRVLEVEFMDGARETRSGAAGRHRAPALRRGRLHGRRAPSRRCGSPGREINLVHISVDAGGLPALNAAVKATPGIAGMTLWTEVRAQLPRDHGREPGDLDHHLLRCSAPLIAIGVVYNAARIQLSERAHELASLRILGFSRGEVSFVLLGELLGLAAAGDSAWLPARLRLRRLDRLGLLDRYPDDPAGDPTRHLRLCRPCRRRGGDGLGPGRPSAHRPARPGGRDEDEGVRRWHS